VRWGVGMSKVLIIEDDTIIGEMLSLYLSEESFTVHRVELGQESLDILPSYMPDIILLDLTLPDMDGADLCSLLREQTTAPIIVVSMKHKVTDRIQALSAGADDFLSKPFSMQELRARILAQLRRSQAYSNPDHAAGAAMMAAAISGTASPRIRIDVERRIMFVEEHPVEITFSEFEIMKLFYNYPGKVFSRDELINAIRGLDSYINERSIDVHVTNLRKKIELNPKQPNYIKTVWGVGYKFNTP
jgi:two-component system response regulator RegX3